MSYKADQHSHSFFSFDSKNNLDEMCKKAISIGFDEIAITDHKDFYQSEVLKRLEVPFDHDAAYNAICDIKEKYKDRLKVSVGVEFGQPTEDPEFAKELLSSHNYDMVIGSLHSLYRMPDFYLLDFSKITGGQCDLFITQYFKEIEELVDWGDFDTLAHLTYPIRYIKAGGHNVDLEKHIPQIKIIFEKLIEKGIALEVNSSGYRQGLGGPLPDYEILKLYREIGGEYITVGGDGHTIEDLCLNIERVYEKLKSLGFKYICSFTERKIEKKEI